MINVLDFRDCVIRPTLQRIDLWSFAAEQLVLATAIHESSACYLRQIGGGPAVGFFQMEKATHDDIWANYLEFKPGMAGKISSLTADWPQGVAQLSTNLAYAAAMCRVHYYRRPEPLPPEGDAEAMAAYWKQFYNTPLGKGSASVFVNSFDEYVAPWIGLDQ